MASATVTKARDRDRAARKRSQRPMFHRDGAWLRQSMFSRAWGVRVDRQDAGGVPWAGSAGAAHAGEADGAVASGCIGIEAVRSGEASGAVEWTVASAELASPISATSVVAAVVAAVVAVPVVSAAAAVAGGFLAAAG